MPFSSRPVPSLARIRQTFPRVHIADVRTETRQRLLAAGLSNRVKPGQRIAITAGSRGMGKFIELLCGICDAVNSLGGKPFLIPAMGSHGGATARGQVKLLQRLGINENTVPTPIEATMDTVALGKTETGAIAHIDQIAAKADGIIVLGRVKTHPENSEGVASGRILTLPPFKSSRVGPNVHSGALRPKHRGCENPVGSKTGRYV